MYNFMTTNLKRLEETLLLEMMDCLIITKLLVSTKLLQFFLGELTLFCIATKMQFYFSPGEMSSTLMWYNYIWRRSPENEGKEEPEYLNPHYMQHVHPEAKFIVMLRNPIERLGIII